MKSNGVAYILWFLWLFGLCGIHRIYAGRIISGLIWLFTFGLLGIGQLIDVFLIPSIIDDENRRSAAEFSDSRHR